MSTQHTPMSTREREEVASRVAALLELFGSAWMSRHADCSTATDALVYQGAVDLLESAQEDFLCLQSSTTEPGKSS